MKKKIISLGLTILMVMNAISVNAYVREFDQGEIQSKHITEGGYDAGYDPDYDANELDTQEVKYYIDEYFTFSYRGSNWGQPENQPSGWDLRDAGGSGKGSYYTTYQMNDDKDTLPVELSRKFESAKSGELTLDFTVKFSTKMNGATFRIYGDRDIALSLEIQNGNWSLLKNDGSYITLTEAKTETEYGIRAIFNVGEKIIKKIYINGKLYNVNIPFVTNIDKVNSFSINSGEKATGTITISTVQLFRGYRVYDRFISYAGILPEDYVVDKGIAKLKYVEENSFPDQYSLSLNSNSKVTKKYDVINGHIEYGFHIIVPDKSDNMKFSINGKTNEILSFYTENGNFGYDTGVKKENIYEFMPNVWYYIRYDVDLNTQKGNMYINNRLEAENISIGSFDGVDELTIETNAVKSEVRVDDIYVAPYIEEPIDYVPTPEPVESKGYQIGMQFCPMYVNGHHLGWDAINYDKERLPYLGFYDENNPETIDWMIKQLVEHGIDFARVTWCMQPGNDNPVNKPFFGYSWIDAFQRSKYKDMIDYMIIWENNTMGSSADILVNSAGPYWIEHYLKDDNYYRINGRPVISLLGGDTFIAASGGKEAAAEGIKKFREMCAEAGVGDPIITGIADPTVGFDGVASYFATSGDQIGALQDDLDLHNNKTNFMKSISMGLDGTVWGSSVTGWNTPESFKKTLLYARDEYMPAVSNSNLFKNHLMIETYDELGEGHFPSPAGLYGFSYFDAIREVFTDGGEHTDVVPTMKQKDRFNNLYPYGRNIGQIDKPVKAMTDPQDMETIEKWDFGNGSLSGWSYANATVDASGENMNLVSKDDPQIMISQLNVDLTAVPYVRVRLKYADYYGGYAQLFFTTTDAPGLSEGNAAILTLTKQSVGNNMYDMYFDMSLFSAWKGTLTGLRFDPVVQANCEVEIESIELLYDEKLAERLKEEATSKPQVYYCRINGELFESDKIPHTVGYNKYAPLRDVANALNYKVEYDGYNNVANVINGSKIYRFDFSKSAIFDENWKEITKFLDDCVNINGITYISNNLLEYIVGISFTYVEQEQNAETTNLTLTYLDGMMKWDFNDNSGKYKWKSSKSMGNVNIRNSWMTADISGIYPALQADLPKEKHNSTIESIELRLVNETDSQICEIAFCDNDGKWYNETSSFEIKPQDSVGCVYKIEDTAKYDNGISKVLIKLGNNKGVVALDYIYIDLLENTGEEN